MERKIKQQLEPARLLLLFWQVVLLLPGCLAAFGGFAAAPKLAIGLSAPCSSLLIISGSWCSQTGSGVIGCSLSVRLPCLTLELEQTCTDSLKNVQKCNVLTRLVPRKKRRGRVQGNSAPVGGEWGLCRQATLGQTMAS